MSVTDDQDEEPCLLPPARPSVFKDIVRRIRAANTIFEDRVKLELRQSDMDHWSQLKLPYLLVVPMQTRTPTGLDIDYMSFVNPRVVAMVAQFEDCNSGGSWMAADAIEQAERELIWVLVNWSPKGTPISRYLPTLYGGSRIIGTRAPDVKVSYNFIVREEVVLPQEAPHFGEDELAERPFETDITLNIRDSCCVVPEEPELAGPRIKITSGCNPCPPPPRCEDECEPVLISEMGM